MSTRALARRRSTSDAPDARRPLRNRRETLGMLAGVALLLWVVSISFNRKTRGYAPGWQCRCVTCGYTEPAS